MTDGLGNFLFPYVQPDTYNVKVSLEGFQTIEQTNVQVNANDRLTVGPVHAAGREHAGEHHGDAASRRTSS